MGMSYQEMLFGLVQVLLLTLASYELSEEYGRKDLKRE